MSGNRVINNQELGTTESQQNFMEPGNGQQAQDNIANTLQGAGISLNSGLTQNYMSGGETGSMSNDLVDSTESTEGRQMIGNGERILKEMFNAMSEHEIYPRGICFVVVFRSHARRRWWNWCVARRCKYPG